MKVTVIPIVIGALSQKAGGKDRRNFISEEESRPNRPCPGRIH